MKRFLQTPPQAPTRDYDVANKKYTDDAIITHEAAYDHSEIGSGVSLTVGLDAAKPASGFTGQRFYFATDTGKLYIDTGAAWVSVKGVWA